MCTNVDTLCVYDPIPDGKQNYIDYVFNIHEMLQLFNIGIKVVIHFVPGHEDIRGNEMVYFGANGAHASVEIVYAPLSQN